MDRSVDEILADVVTALTAFLARYDTATHDDSSTAHDAVVLPVFTGQFPIYFSAVSAPYQPSDGMPSAAAAA